MDATAALRCVGGKQSHLHVYLYNGSCTVNKWLHITQFKKSFVILVILVIQISTVTF